MALVSIKPNFTFSLNPFGCQRYKPRLSRGSTGQGRLPRPVFPGRALWVATSRAGCRGGSSELAAAERRAAGGLHLAPAAPRRYRHCGHRAERDRGGEPGGSSGWVKKHFDPATSRPASSANSTGEHKDAVS